MIWQDKFDIIVRCYELSKLVENCYFLEADFIGTIMRLLKDQDLERTLDYCQGSVPPRND